MRKSYALLVLAAIFSIGAGWWFFTYGGNSSPSTSEDQDAIVKIRDERLGKGLPGAPVKAIEYIDILCPYCAKVHQPGDSIPRLMEEYVEPGKVHFEMRIVAKISPDSELAGVGAYCAAEQNKFWQYIDKAYADSWNKYYSQNKKPTDVDIFRPNTIDSFAKSVPGLDSLSWRQCMDDNSYKDTMQQNSDDMARLRAYGTPTMVVDGKSYTGAPPYSAFQAVINASLNEKRADGKE